MPKSINYRKLLNDLKYKLDKKEMSTLVGAGFSKNIDESFPNWFELIHEMVIFTEGRRLEKEFKSRFPDLNLKSEEYTKYLKDEVWNHINSVGPLKTVSIYIKAKGFREAVDHMVDQHTPVIEVSHGQRYLCRFVEGKIEKKLLTDSDVASHEKLVNLPWNNIFTTNYDNLLEKCIDISKKSEIKSRISDLDVNISQRKEVLNSVQKQIEEKTAERDEMVAKFGNMHLEAGQQQQNLEFPDEKKGALIEEIKKLNGEISRLQGQTRFEELFIKRHEVQIRELNDLNNEFRTTVTKSSELAIRRNQNIIKIHGSIYTDEPKVFGFDGDASKNYVIAQEDYDSYPQKHEAFMQLMRISLLQESFCLFGFSGIDPNFLGWIGWVRDVIQKNHENTSGTDKIYMIDVGDQEADPAKALFYKNHQIAFIPLGHPNCLKDLEELTGTNVVDDSPKAKINLLLDFLSTDKVPSDYKIAYEVLKQNEYQNLWENRLFSVDATEKIKRLVNNADKIVALKSYNRIPLLFGDTDQEQIDALSQFEVVYLELKEDPEQVAALLKVTLIMLQEVYLPHSVLFIRQEHIFYLILELSRERNLFYEDFLILDLRDAVWRNDTEKVKSLELMMSETQNQEIQQELWHQTALHAFYNFKFEKLCGILDSWEATGHWAMKKAGLLSHFSLDDAIDVLKDSKLRTAQENVYKYHILSYLHAANNFRGTGEEEYKIVRAIEKGNIKSFKHTVDRLVKNLKKKPEKLLPYGEGKFNITNSLVLSKSSEQRISLQLLYLWLESGHPLHLTYVNYLSVYQVYKPLLNGLLWFPQPAIYFALQFSDSNFIIRFTQDLIYNDNLKDHLSTIAANIMQALFDAATPSAFQKNLLIVLSELISVLAPSEWQAFYLKVWETQMQRKFLAQDLRIKKQEFLTKGIPLLTDSGVAEIIINQLLETFLKVHEKQVKDNVIQMLYQFRSNNYLNAQVKTGGLKISVTHFDELVSRLKTDIFFLFVLGNISFLFNDGQDALVKKILHEMDAFNNENSSLWKVILYFGNGDLGIEQKVKKEILQAKALWNSGINSTISQYTGHHDFISLSPLRRYRSGKSLLWTTQEVQSIYERMVPELNNIDHWIRNYGQDGEFREIIREMKLFIEAEEASLMKQENFIAVREKIHGLYNLERSSEQNVEALLGDDKSEINIEINNISEEIYSKDRLAENEFLITALVYRLLLRKEPGVAAALTAVSNWFFYLPGQELLEKYKRHLELILASYKDGRDINMDEPTHQECLIKLAIVLKRWNSDEVLIRPKLDLLLTSRYNFIRHNLRAEFDADGVDFN